MRSAKEVTVATSIRLKSGRFIPLTEAIKSRIVVEDQNYVDGAITLTIGGKPILTEVEWDLVDQLWAYILAGLETLESSASWWTHFPDQGIRLSIERAGDQAQVGVSYRQVNRVATCRYQALRRAMLDGALEAFQALTLIAPENAQEYEQYLSEIEEFLKR